MNKLFTTIKGIHLGQRPYCIGKQPRCMGIMLGCLGFWLLSNVLTATRALGAEQIYIVYGPLKFSLPVKSLETYAKEGKIDGYLADYAKHIPPQQLKQLPKFLTTPLQFTPVAVSQCLYSIQGEILLEHLGQIVQSESGRSGFYAIRSALILASADPEGLTILNVLQKFPTRGIRIDMERGLQIAEELKKLSKQTQAASAAIEQQSVAEAAGEPKSNLTQLADLASKGTFSWHKNIVKVSYTYKGRKRAFEADIYLPVPPAQSLQLGLRSAPVIVISHGLNSNRTTFEYLAKHLVSYGFAVAVPEHPGSTDKHFQSLLAGQTHEFVYPTEFIDTSLDIKYLLNELEQRSQDDPVYKGRLNVQQVGAIGQSFAGYTALALAGAKIDFGQLQKDCQIQPNSVNFLNLSLQIQCTLLKLPPSEQDLPNLRDERVKAAIALNPTASGILGQTGFSQIQVPVMLVAGSADTIAPALLEVIQPFTWLTSSEKYLALIKGATHFSALDESALRGEGIFSTIKAPGVEQLGSQFASADLAATHTYVSALSVAFLQTYVANQPEKYRPYLSATSAKAMSQRPFSLHLVRFLRL